MTPERARHLITNILKAVRFMHSAGVLHRDLKPSNLMVLPDLSVRIIDFGISRGLGC